MRMVIDHRYRRLKELKSNGNPAEMCIGGGRFVFEIGKIWQCGCEIVRVVYQTA